MTIIEIKIACYLYERFTDYDKEYKKLRAVNQINLNQRDHTIILIHWLRGWGCRQFKTENNEMSIKNIMEWYSLDSSNLPVFELQLIHCNDDSLNKTSGIFNRLSNTKISERRRNNKNIDVTVGPVGAAKILFALCPNFYSPWDKPICIKKGYQSNGISYVKFLNDIKQSLKELKAECDQKGYNIEDLPKKIDRPNSTLTKIIDEYNWVTLTRQCNPLEILRLSR
jgi:hypothetical protein